MLILAVAEEAAARGISYYDLGYGQHSYKLRLANTSYPVAGGAVWVNRAEELVRRIYRQRVLARRVPGSGAQEAGSGAREPSGSSPAFELAS